VGSIAETLASAVQANGGQVLCRHEVTAILRGEAGTRPVGKRGLTRFARRAMRARPYRIETQRGTFEADVVVANLTPWALVKLLGDEAPVSLRQRVTNLRPISSAFMAYLGVDEAAVEEEVDHHQVIVDPDKPLGEGNSVFVSISPHWDRRAPTGQRAITISTHTRAAAWYELAKDEAAFEDRKQLYLERLIAAASLALPKLKPHIRLALPGTPLTFERFTQRVNGMVGGFPQKNLWASWAPQIDRKVWLVGDSVFPGQSTAGVTLGALRVAREIERSVPATYRRHETSRGEVTIG